jgi:hypothetical protein
MDATRARLVSRFGIMKIAMARLRRPRRIQRRNSFNHLTDLTI